MCDYYKEINAIVLICLLNDQQIILPQRFVKYLCSLSTKGGADPDPKQGKMTNLIIKAENKRKMKHVWYTMHK